MLEVEIVRALPVLKWHLRNVGLRRAFCGRALGPSEALLHAPPEVLQGAFCATCWRVGDRLVVQAGVGPSLAGGVREHAPLTSWG